MRLFVTGATGFIGTALIPELKKAGHAVVGLARNDAGVAKLEGMGVTVHRGVLEEPESLAQGARNADGVIHLAFDHDFTRFVETGKKDNRAVAAMLAVLEGTGKPFVVTSGVNLVTGKIAEETDRAPREGLGGGRGASEHASLDAVERGVRAMVVRLPQVHDTRRQGLITPIVIARQRGFVAYVGDGSCQVGSLAELPVTMSGTRPLIRAKLNGEETSFLADSGAFFSMLTPAAAAQFHLRVGMLPYGMRVSGVGGEAANAGLTTAKRFSLAGFEITNQDFIVAGNSLGGGAVGLIGQNVFRVADVEYDLGNGVIRLMQPRGCEKSDLAYWAGEKPVSVLEIERPTPQEPHTYGEAKVNGVRIRVLFDTGASTSVLGSRAASRAGIKTDRPGVRFAGYSSGVGRQMIKNWIAPVASFEVGGEKITNTQLRVGDIGSGEDMLLGADFFLSHRIYVANSQRRMYFTYNGGPVFNLKRTNEASTASAPAPGGAPDAAPPATASGPATEAPKDADGFARRAAASAARHDYEAALADYDRAIALAPREADYLFERAGIQMSQHRPALAMSDLEAAIQLKPDAPRFRLARAAVKLSERDTAGARADLDAAAEHTPKESDARLQIAQSYLAADQVEPAVGQLDLWIAAHRDDNRMPQALAERCFARVLSGRELERAKPDSDGALRAPLRPVVAMVARGMLEYRRGEFDRAQADLDAVLKGQPRNPWALYARGLARLKKGDKVGSDADLAAAAVVAPRLPKRAKSFGLGP